MGSRREPQELQESKESENALDEDLNRRKAAGLLLQIPLQALWSDRLITGRQMRLKFNHCNSIEALDSRVWRA